MVLVKEVDRENRLISRFIISFRKDNKNKSLKLKLIKKKIYSPKYYFIIKKNRQSFKELKKYLIFKYLF